MGGLKDWWDKMTGKADKEAAQKEGLSDSSDQSTNDYLDMKADSAVEQRDPGLMHMGDGER